MPRFKLTLSYDGTTFVGWQRQASGLSIQQVLEDVLAVLDAAPVTVIGAGRTDSGVHALAQVAHLTLTRTIDAPTLMRALNASLPDAIRVTDACEVPPTFHAQFSATRKTYRYRLWNSDVLSPFERPYVWHVLPPPLDREAMAAAARHVEGAHDFVAFQGAGGRTRTTDREIFSSRVTSRPGDPLITYEVCGTGFLKYMVRTIVGSLVEVGRGRQRPAWIADAIASKSRAEAGPTAPAQGLFLVRVDYDNTELADGVPASGEGVGESDPLRAEDL